MLRRLTFPIWSAPLVLLGVTLAAYGLFAAQQGYAWDDWGFVWVSHYIGRTGLNAYFAVARPFWSNLFAVTTFLIGADPLAWQIFALTARALWAATLWWALRLVWPRQPRFVFAAALLALVYPGFSQHSIALVYGHYSLTFALFFVSLALSVLSMRAARGRRWTILLGAALSAVHLFSTEYYFGLELLRPALMWIAAGETLAGWPRIWKTARVYLPYSAIVVVFLVWRIFFFRSALYDMEVGASVQSLSGLLSNAAGSLWTAAVAAWVNAFHAPPIDAMGTRLARPYLLVVLGAWVALAAYSARISQETKPTIPEAERRPFGQWLGVSAAALLLAGIPFAAAGLQVKLIFPADRFTQPFAVGAALLLAAALEWIPKPDWRAAATGALAALAIGAQIQFAFAFREDWRAQENFFWQLSWRAPALKEGAVIVTETSPFHFTDDDALTFALNWLYAPIYRGGDLPYAQVFLSTRPGLLETTTVEWHLLSTNFSSTTDALLLARFAPPSCLRVLHPLYDADLPVAPRSRETTEALLRLGVPLLRREEAAALPLTNIEQIVAAPETPARPPEEIFGAEPPHQWCYYFEKADLARSQGNWEEVARLGDEAFSVPYYPHNPAEYLPFIEAYARLGRLSQAKKLTLDTALQMPILKPSLCALWQRVAADVSWTAAERFFIQQIQNDLRYCPVKNANE